MTWKKVGSKIAHKNPWYSVREDEVIRPDGSPGKYFVVDILPGVIVVPFDGKKFYVVEQFRHTHGVKIWDFPAGRAHPKERPIDSAKRELKEETGFIAKKWTKLGTFIPNVGYSNETMHAYLAQELSLEMNNLDQTESDLVTKALTVQEIKTRLRKSMVTGSCLACLTLLQLNTNLKIF
jgi:ADP-ribose pyrophosphatase YjhB (NUDIX family)